MQPAAYPAAIKGAHMGGRGARPCIAQAIWRQRGSHGILYCQKVPIHTQSNQVAWLAARPLARGPPAGSRPARWLAPYCPRILDISIQTTNRQASNSVGRSMSIYLMEVSSDLAGIHHGARTRPRRRAQCAAGSRGLLGRLGWATIGSLETMDPSPRGPAAAKGAATRGSLK